MKKVQTALSMCDLVRKLDCISGVAVGIWEFGVLECIKVFEQFS